MESFGDQISLYPRDRLTCFCRRWLQVFVAFQHGRRFSLKNKQQVLPLLRKIWEEKQGIRNSVLMKTMSKQINWGIKLEHYTLIQRTSVPQRADWSLLELLGFNLWIKIDKIWISPLVVQEHVWYLALIAAEMSPRCHFPTPISNFKLFYQCGGKFVVRTTVARKLCFHAKEFLFQIA